ncbi:MAG: nitronate monooxygenase [Proteobacteria bacterium]|nr:nitronate monooxygenase [Pseudomonadota bacterium]NIS71343.1 nitronate monooxygenase [Pseudomonadota bacterium]
MMKTRITELFGIDYPILGGTMMHLSDASWSAAVSQTGALGIIASAMFRDKESFRREVQKAKKLTQKPIAVNLNMFPAMQPIDNSEYIDVILDEGIEIVETSGHKAPEEYIDRLKKNGVKIIHKCVGIRYAKKAESLGVDAVTVVGYENGGATGMLDITTLCLVPRVVDALTVPVIGGGGVADGRGLLAVLSLGAEGVIMGTRLLATKECPIHENLKKALLGATELDTTLVLRSIQNTHRVWQNSAASRVQEMESRGASLDELFTIIKGENMEKVFREGDLDVGLVPCGQGVGLTKEIKPVKEVISDILREAEEAKARLQKIL